MKNLKIYRKALALVAASSLLLMSGCSASTEGSKSTEESKKNEPCTHLTVYFEDQPITFKECEGYDIDTRRYNRSSEITYTVKKNDKKYFEGVTVSYNDYVVYHESVDQEFDIDSVQKVK